MNDSQDRPSGWWSWRLLGRWVLLNVSAYIVIVIGGVVLEQLASDTTKDLAADHRPLAVLLVALIGASLQGFVLGNWQWHILRIRMPDLPRRRWIVATLAPAFIVWLLAIAPAAVDTLAQGGDTLNAFKNGFIQALVLGPLIGLSQATALRDYTTRWKWWFAANVTTWLLGALTYEFGKWLFDQLSMSRTTSPAFPIAAFFVHGAWMLWVTAPDATADVVPAMTQLDPSDNDSPARPTNT